MAAECMEATSLSMLLVSCGFFELSVACCARVAQADFQEEVLIQLLLLCSGICSVTVGDEMLMACLD